MTDKQAHKQWHVVYTRSRAEKKVLRELHDCKIECFLPMQKQLRQWKDRKKWVEMPLIPGYCFVNISRKEYDQVLQLSNVVQYLRFERKAAIISEQEIEALQTMLHQFDFEVAITMENFEPGKRVEVIKGPMVGLKGELVEMRGKNKFALRLEQIETSFLVEIPAHYLSAVPELKK